MNELRAIEIAQNAMSEMIAKEPDLKLRYEVAAAIGLVVWRETQQELKHVATVADVYESRYTIELNGASIPEGTPLYAVPNVELSGSPNDELETER